MTDGVLSRVARLWRRPVAATAAAPPPEPGPEAAPGLAVSGAAVRWCRIGPMGGGLLSVDFANGRRLAVADGLMPAVFAVVPAALPHLCLLLAPDGLAFHLDGDELCAIALSLRILRTDKADHVRLRHPLGPTSFLAIGDRLPGQAGTAVHLNGKGTDMQAVFRLLPLADGEAPAGVMQDIAGEIGAAAAARLDAAALLDGLRQGALRPGLAAPLVRAMPSDALGDLARRALAHTEDLAVLQRAMPDDPWMRDHLPALAAWTVSRAPLLPSGSAASPASDEALILPTSSNGPIPAGLALQVLARRQMVPRRGACVLATARNEGAYLLDWISYHLSIGFEHIFLYSNDNQDGSDALLALLARHGVISWVDNTRTANIGPQDKAYAHALTLLPQILDFRWTAILDLDEYLAFDRAMFGGIDDFISLQEAQPVDAIALCWAMFVGLPGERWSAQPTPGRFPRRLRDINIHVKTLFRTRLFWHAQPHFPYAIFNAPFDYRTEDGGVHHHAGVRNRIPAFAENPSANQAWINHYMLRTAPEAVWKWSRGRGDWLREDSEKPGFMDFIASTFLDFARPESLVEDRRIDACARGQQTVLDRILALPGVAACEAEIQARFAVQIRQAADDFLAAPGPPEPPRTLRHFRGILAAARADM